MFKPSKRRRLDESSGGSHPAALEGRPDKSSGVVQPVEKSDSPLRIDSLAPSNIVQPEITASSSVVQPAGERNDADYVDGSGQSSTVQPVVSIEEIKIPRVLKPLAKLLATSINKFAYTGIDQEEYYEVRELAFDD